MLLKDRAHMNVEAGKFVGRFRYVLETDLRLIIYGCMSPLPLQAYTCVSTHGVEMLRYTHTNQYVCAWSRPSPQLQAQTTL